MRNLSILLLFTFFVFQNATADGQRSDSKLFSTDDILEITLIADFDILLQPEEEVEVYDFDEEDQFDEPAEAEEVDQYIPAKMLYSENGSSKHSLDIKVRTRGHFRRSYCDFPPLKFQFLPESIVGTPFENQFKLKMVTHCEKDVQKFSHAIISEYLLYKSYQILTDQSLDVRLVRLKYQVKPETGELVTSYAFFLQSIDEVAASFNAYELTDPAFFADPPELKTDLALSFFQYMIGNSDWELPGHNCKMIVLNDKSDTIAVPYDFDLAYLANAHSFPLPVKEFKGDCPTAAELKATVDQFNSVKDEFIALYKNCKWLEPIHASKNIEHIEGFYQSINDPASLKELLSKVCAR